MTSNSTNRAITLAARPVGAPKPSDFRLVERAVPTAGNGQVLLRSLWLSLDPYMRRRMDDVKSYAPAVQIGEVMVGGAVSVVAASKHSGFAVGDLVVGRTGWQEYALSDGEGLMKVDPKLAPLSTYLGVMGMPGMTAYVGLANIGKPQPGETLVVAAASGAVGSVVGQIAKMKGCRVVGIAGDPDKVRYLTEQLGFDVGLDHRAPDFAAQLEAACPKGIDVYYENVGGKVWQAVFPLLNPFARVPVCGVIAHYSDSALPPGPDRSMALMSAILWKRLTLRGFIVSDFASQQGDFMRDMAGWLKSGKMKYREDVVVGLENAPQAFIGLLEGRNFGKLLVKIADL